MKDYWADKLNVSVGRDNFDELRYEYFRDTTVALEAFKADTVDWRTENSAKNWATAYDFPAVTDKRVVLEEFPINNYGVMQAFAFNIRRAKFQDPRVRLAFNFAFDFEEMNKQIFFGQYKRIDSYFEGTELASSGLPEGRELEILETVRDKVPPEVFTTAYSNPVGGNPQAVRDNLREAVRLFKEAGYEIRNEKLVNSKTGEPYVGRIPGRGSELRACLFVLQTVARPARRHRDASASSMPHNTKTGCATGTSTSSPMPGANRCRPATSSAAIGARRPPTSPARSISSASRTPRSMP